jgi:hypothetical protein
MNFTLLDITLVYCGLPHNIQRPQSQIYARPIQGPPLFSHPRPMRPISSPALPYGLVDGRVPRPSTNNRPPLGW